MLVNVKGGFSVKAKDDIIIDIDGEELFLKDKKTFCRVAVKGGEIKMQAL